MLSSFITALSSLVERRPLAVVLTIVVVSAVLFLSLTRLRVDADNIGALPPGDPIYDLTYEMEDRFGTDILLFVIVEAENVFAPPTLERMRRLANAISKLDGVVRVTHLGNALSVNITDELMEVAPIAEGPISAAAAERIKSLHHSSLIYKNRLVTPDDKGALIVAQVEERKGNEGYKRAVVDGIRKLLATYSGPEKLQLFGGLTITQTVADSIIKDFRLLVPLTAFVLALLLSVLVKSVRGAFFPILVGLLCLGWTFGLKGLLGGELTLTSVFLLPVLLASTCAYVVHLLGRYDEVLAEEGSAGSAARTVESMALPVMLASFTTALGFLSYVITDMSLVVDLGIWGAVGVSFGALGTILLIPSLLRLLQAGPTRRARRNPLLLGILDRHAYFLLVHRRKVLPGAFLVAAVVCAGIAKLRIETQTIEVFPKDSAVRKAYDVLAERFGGGAEFYVNADTGAPEGAIDPAFLDKLSKLRRELLTWRGVSSAVGPDVFIGEVNRKLTANPEAALVPSSAAEVAQILLLYKGTRSISSVLDMENRIARLSLVTNIASEGERHRLFQRVQERAREVLGKGVATHVLGRSVLIAAGYELILKGQLESLLLAALVIGGLMVLLFRSLRLGLLAMVPNVLPIVMLFGCMGWLDVPLTPMTMIMTSTALGIAVDDTIHFLVRFYQELRQTGHFLIRDTLGQRRTDEQVIAMMRTVSTVGQPIVVTSLALSAAFAVLLLSSFPPVMHLGALSALTMGVCLFADMFVLPVLLISIRV